MTANKTKTAANSHDNNRAKQAPDLNDPALFINRELSWLQFNHMVMEEALDTSLPLLERVKFLAIFANNLDEFFMVRVSGLRSQLSAGVLEGPPDGMTPAEQLAEIRKQLLPELTLVYDCWSQDIRPKLEEAGVKVLHYEDLKEKPRKILHDYFERELFPTLTPLAFDPGHPFPHISNLSMNLAVIVRDPENGERFARLKVPGTFPRLVRIPRDDSAESLEALGLEQAGQKRFVWIEDVISANLDLLFPGIEIVAAYPFRVTRDADVEIEEDEAADLLTAIEEGVGMRYFGSAVRLEVDSNMPERIRTILTANLELAPYQVYTVDGPIGPSSLMELTEVNRPDLKFRPFQPAVPPALMGEESIFSVIRRRNILLYHPYESFSPVIDFMREAATDPRVLAIKQTLYRTDQNSPIVAELMRAREHGKQVAVLVELKARFDEENNIVWARELERAGVHVVYGLVGLKTHCKLLMVIRRDEDGLHKYVHMSTGNYNTVTARVYTDISYLTCDQDIGMDIADLFNALTGYSRQNQYRKLLVAPGTMRQEILNRIDREIEHQQEYGNGYIALKLNSLVDKESIQALYRASQAGVRIDLQIRGICCLRPGVPGVSENVTVTTIVGRFLEHTRIFYFRNNGAEEVLLGSADLMPRNLDRRVEVLFPIEDPALKDAIHNQILTVHLADNANARQLLPDGSYIHVKPHDGEPEINSQQWMLERRGVWNAEP